MKNCSVLTLDGVSRLRAFPAGLVPFGAGNLPELLKKYAGRAVYENTRHNLIVTTGLSLVAAMINNEAAVGLTYHAIGTSAQAPVATDTLLVTEASRKAWTSQVRTAGAITFTIFYLASESTFNIQECGTFGGAAASLTPNTGTLFSRYLQPFDNSAGLVDLTFEYELTVGA